jgi:hypothetical protein
MLAIVLPVVDRQHEAHISAISQTRPPGSLFEADRVAMTGTTI